MAWFGLPILALSPITGLMLAFGIVSRIGSGFIADRIGDRPFTPREESMLEEASKYAVRAIHNERVKPSFDYRDNDGTQVEEYRFQKGQAPDIHVKSGMGTSYNMSKPEDSSPRIRERGNIDRVPSVNVLKF